MESLERVSLAHSKIEVGHFGFICFSLVNMLFLPIGFSSRRCKLVHQGIYDWSFIGQNSTVGEVHELIQDTQEGKPRNCDCVVSRSEN